VTSIRVAHLLLFLGLLAPLGLASAGAPERAGPTPATIAALPPAVTANRGADLPFVEYEAENAVTNGEVIGPDRAFGSLTAEASGRRAVRLDGVGGYVEMVLDRPADAVTLRYALPDSADGHGLDAAIAVYADGRRLRTLALTSRYSWFYGRYPFSNRPADGGGHHIFDEARLLLGSTLAAGTRVRFVVETPDAAAWRLIDLADFELVGAPKPRPADAISVLDFGADPTGVREASRALRAAVAAGRKSGRVVWLDPGRYRLDRHLFVDSVTLAGAGPWHSVLAGDGVGVFGRDSRHVVLRDFAILGEVRSRVDKAQLAGVGGAMSDSRIENLWIQHTKAGLWFDGPMANIVVSRVRVLDQAADGLNFHRGVTDAVVEDSFVRNSGDDGLAAWSHRIANARITFRRNTVIAPGLANGIALYGGGDLTVAGNLVADTVTEGGGLHLGARFSATPFSGLILWTGNTVVRGGVMDPNWRIGVGAIWLYALDAPIDGATIRFEDSDLIDSGYEAIQFVGRPISGVSFSDIRIDGAGTYALQLQSPGAARFSRVTARRLGLGGVHDCGSGFTLTRDEGNSGWEEVACPSGR
jgi:hypothetical protein